MGVKSPVFQKLNLKVEDGWKRDFGKLSEMSWQISGPTGASVPWLSMSDVDIGII